jgi:Ca-activated chloride channel family protein
MVLPELALQQPLWLLLWPGGPLAVWLARTGRQSRWQLSSPADLFGLRIAWRNPAAAVLDQTSDHTPPRRPTRLLFPLLAWSCAVLAMAQPVRLAGPLPAPRPPVDLYVLLDTSVSMVLRDYRDTSRDQTAAPIQRLSFAKGLLDRLAADYGGDRLGLYLVGSPSRRLLPPTSDHALFRHILAQVPSVLAGRRSNLGDALARVASDLAERSRDRDAVALLVTDGTQPSGHLSPQAGAERLHKAGIPLYVLAVGAGSQHQRPPGSLLFGGARPVQLERLAEITGGQSFQASDIQALQAAMQTLTDRFLAGKATTPSRREPLYQWLLLLGLLSLAVARHLPRSRQ